MLEQIHKTQTNFLETELLLRKIDNEILKIEESNKRVNQINTLYEQAHGLARSKSWRKALDKIEEIYKLDSQFEDKDLLAEKSKAELEREDLAAQKQNQLAAMYADAVRLLKEGKYQESLEKWDEVKSIDPKYPDRQRVDASARKKLAEINKERKYKTPFWENKSFFKWPPVLLLVAIVLGIVIFTMLSPKVKIATITVPGKIYLGAKYQVPVSGYFTFQYVDSAYTAYDLYSYNSPELRIWDTMVQCYKGEEPQWSGISLDASKALFTLGSMDFSTKEIAIESTSGVYKKIRLEKGEWLTCVVADGKWDYSDNSGEVILDVYYSLK
jgi:tetratricopeptide (TPR) repeat protein